ncbi:MAG: cysteine desulfurase NifS [candidate division Zixibacteria bacterium]|nr:cysteine desulfurase NifS [candidate division Zixibacteria bacterium]
MKRVYLDHNATTPVHPEVFQAMKPFCLEEFGNASSIHGFGRFAREAVENARETIAKICKCSPEEIVFTSGGTESDNMAIKGTAWQYMKKGQHIITSAIEHPAILESCHFLEQYGFQITYLKSDNKGIISPDDLKKAIRDDTILVSIMHANNETGAIQPIAELANIAHEKDILFHTDAVQSTCKIPYTIGELGVDMLSISGHKIYGPKGIGLFYIKKNTKIQQLSHGGSHENNHRAGTENVAGIVGIAKAIEISWQDMAKETARLRSLTGKFISELKNRIDDIDIVGDIDNRVPNTVNVVFKAIEGESIVLSLDLKGIAVSSGSACSSGAVEPSHVIMAMGIPAELAQGSIRFSFGRSNDESDVEYVLDVLQREVKRLRSISPLYHN